MPLGSLIEFFRSTCSDGLNCVVAMVGTCLLPPQAASRTATARIRERRMRLLFRSWVVLRVQRIFQRGDALRGLAQPAAQLAVDVLQHQEVGLLVGLI